MARKLVKLELFTRTVVMRALPERLRRAFCADRNGARPEAVTGWKKCFEGMNGVMKVRHYSPKTLKSYTGWVRDFRRYLGSKDPVEVGMDDVERYLTAGQRSP